jgi:hypothetical protein
LGALSSSNFALLNFYTILILDFNAIPGAGNVVFCRAAGHNSLLFSILDLAIHFQVSSYGFIHLKTEQISDARNCMRNVDKMFRRRAQRMLIRDCSFTVGDYLHGYIETYTNS